MHDPMSVQFEIRRPWPKRVNWSTRKWYFPALVTVWHVDPEADGTDDSCRVMRNRWAKFHVHHWRIQIHPAQRLRKWLFTRCEFCGERGPSLRLSTTYHRRPKRRMLQGDRDLFHFPCGDSYRELDLQRAKAMVKHDEERKALKERADRVG